MKTIKIMRFFFTLMLATGTVLSCSSKTQYPANVFKTDSGKDVRVIMINHGSLAIEYGNIGIQVDPVASYGGKEIDYTAFPAADFILISHEHGDHLNADTIELLRGEKTRIFINEAGYAKLGKGEIMKNGDSVELSKDIRLSAVPAYNLSEGRTQFHPKGNGNGYVLEIDGLVIYISGDSENIPEMGELKDVDVAILAANQPYTMTEEQCIEAALRIRPEYLIPYHLSDTNVDKIIEGLRSTGIKIIKKEPNFAKE